ncbi:hypothetical protein B5F41_13230 [Gordonibacter sp. An232A]|nr:hypothetical protein B5F41_13230 [Gordonibacter sp. An232A]
MRADGWRTRVVSLDGCRRRGIRREKDERGLRERGSMVIYQCYIALIYPEEAKKEQGRSRWLRARGRGVRTFFRTA